MTNGVFTLNPPKLTPNQQAYFDYALTVFPDFMSLDPEFQVFLYLIAMVAGEIQDNIDNFTNLVDIDNCPQEFLPLLAGNIGYQYDYSASVEENIENIKNYVAFNNIRGSKLAIQLAILFGSGYSYQQLPSLLATQVNSHQFPYNIPNPPNLPTLTAVNQSTPSSSLLAGTYTIGYTVLDSHGNETQISPLNEIQISSGQAIQVSGFELNGGSSVNIYALGLNKNFIYLGNTTSSSYLITKFPVSYSISPGFYNKKLSGQYQKQPPSTNQTGYNYEVTIGSTTYTGPAVYDIILPAFISSLPSNFRSVSPAGFLPVAIRVIQENPIFNIIPSNIEGLNRFHDFSFLANYPIYLEDIFNSQYNNLNTFSSYPIVDFINDVVIYYQDIQSS